MTDTIIIQGIQKAIVIVLFVLIAKFIWWGVTALINKIKG